MERKGGEGHQVGKYSQNRQVLNPPDYKIQNLTFIISPVKDPYSSLGGYADFQPTVTIAVQFVTQLKTGEQVSINYQTSVSTNRYDIPHG